MRSSPVLPVGMGVTASRSIRGAPALNATARTVTGSVTAVACTSKSAGSRSAPLPMSRSTCRRDDPACVTSRVTWSMSLGTDRSLSRTMSSAPDGAPAVSPLPQAARKAAPKTRPHRNSSTNRTRMRSTKLPPFPNWRRPSYEWAPASIAIYFISIHFDYFSRLRTGVHPRFRAPALWRLMGG
jgi:hypothetical protein